MIKKVKLVFENREEEYVVGQKYKDIDEDGLESIERLERIIVMEV